MLKRRGFLFVLCIWLGISLLPLQAMAVEAASYSLSLTSKQVEAGRQVVVDVRGEHVSNLYGYEIKLSYDPKLMKFLKATSPMNGFSVPAIVSGGEVTFAHTKVGKVQGDSGDIVLASMTFELLTEGHAEIKLNQVKQVDSQMIASTISSDVKLAMDIQPKVIEQQMTFPDMINHWAQKAVERAATIGLVNGYEDGTFHPDGKITRAEFIAILVRAITLTSQDGMIANFSDAERIPQWARSYVYEAASAGVISGYEDHSFGADREITRAEMAVMVARAMKLDGSSDLATFSDASQIPSWAIKEVEALRIAGLIHGRDNNSFVPNEHATRAEATMLILAAYDYTATK